MLTMTMPKRLNVVLGGMLGALLMAVVLALPVRAAEPNEMLFPLEEGQSLPVQDPRNLFRGDLTVEGGQVIDDDVLVYSGNVEIEAGGRIDGGLTVFSGNIDIAEGATVDGDVFAASGNVTVAGEVDGDIANMSGNVELRSTAQVDGDISVVSGDIIREEGATIGGNVMEGPSLRFPGSRLDGLQRTSPGVGFESSAPSFIGRVVNFIGRLLGAALLTAFTMLLVGGLFYVRPQLIAETRRNLKEQLALSSVIGVLANLTLLFLAGLMAITICLLPLALLPMLGLLALNVVGWAVASQIVGERIVAFAKQEVQPILALLVGAFVLTGACTLLWAVGGCFRSLAFLLVLAIASLGTGAVMVPWINRRRGDSGTSSEGGGDVPPSGPVGPVPSAGTPEETDVVAGRGPRTGSASPATAGPTSGVGTSGGEMVEHELDAPIDHVTAEEVNTTAERRAAETSAATPEDVKPEATPVDDEVVEQDVAAPIDYVTAQEVITTDMVSEGDDFLQIKGIGPTYARRLKEAGYSTFAQVAAASPEEVGDAIGWPADRVRRNEVIDQAQMLARRS